MRVSGLAPRWSARARAVSGGARSLAGVALRAPVVADRSWVHVGVEQFLSREARLLDDRRWDDWLALWTEDAVYGMPVRRVTGPAADSDERSVDAELVGAGGVWWFDESKETIALRVAKLKTGHAWAEEPPSATRRMVTNVEVTPVDDGLEVRSNVLVLRSRLDGTTEQLSAGRVDRLVGEPGPGLRIASRRVTLDNMIPQVTNLVLFF